ncbi:response regulator transcription factor [Salinimonas lutimaris]|uniref:response regulator transcription factor n=1 Tax=Salinimonas lutimaris TaxID=914153 RepID=UPI0010BF6F8A|nr:response regulator [Salinimonas lutimaris]
MKTLLIIDDDTRLSTVLARRFTQTGLFCVQCFSSASTALRCDTPKADGILLDMMLEDDELGLDYVSELALRFSPQHLIMMTGYASIATTVAALKKGATDYVAKPVGFNELLVMLGEHRVEPEATNSPRPMTPAQAEWEHIQRVLLAHQGNISATAKALGMHRRTLQRKLQKFSPSKD